MKLTPPSDLMMAKVMAQVEINRLLDQAYEIVRQGGPGYGRYADALRAQNADDYAKLMCRVDQMRRIAGLTTPPAYEFHKQHGKWYY